MFNQKQNNAVSSGMFESWWITGFDKLSPRWKSIILINVSTIFQVLLRSTVKYATMEIEHQVHPMDVCFVRTFLLILYSYAIMGINGKTIDGEYKKEHNKYMTIRSIAGTVAQTSMIFAVSYLPITVAGIIYNTYPFFTAVLATIFLNESISKVDMVGLLGSFAGVTIMITQGEQPQKSVATKFLILGVMFAFFNSIGFSFVAVSTRKLKDVHYSVIMLVYSIFATVFYFVYILVEYAVSEDSHFRLFSYPLFPNWPILLVLSVFNVLAMSARTMAFQFEKSAFISLMSYTQVIYACFSDLLIFGIKFNVLQGVGATIVLFFNILSIYYKMKKENLDKEEIETKKIIEFQQMDDNEITVETSTDRTEKR